MNLTEARKRFEHAKKQLDEAASDSWEPQDPPSCVTNVFYAYENLIVALAEAFDVKWTKNHYDKAEIAARLAKDGKLSKDISGLLLHLNDLRKDVSYGEPGTDLLEEDLEGLVTDLESTVDEVDGTNSDIEEEEATQDAE
jgi:hypothetical protein